MAPTPDSDSTATRVLVVDDDPEVAFVLRRYLEAQGFEIAIANDTASARRAMQAPEFDLVLLDLGLPDGNGLTLVTELRLRWAGPVIIVSGRGESTERAVGLELGADDFVTKPFDLRELLARIRSVLRRAAAGRPSKEEARIAFDGLTFIPGSRQLIGRDEHDIPLTSGEFALLAYVLERPNLVLSRDQLLNALHGREAGPFDRSIDVQIGRLRRKIELDPAAPRLIQSVRGAGYLLAGVVERL
jgi:DNA-binding response OmpR family regulator